MALRYTSASTIQVSLDGGAPSSFNLGTKYATASASAKICIGHEWPATGAATNEEIAAVAVLDYALTDAELVAASKFGQQNGNATVAKFAKSGCRFMWPAENYAPASASQSSLGAFPITLTRNGTIARTSY